MASQKRQPKPEGESDCSRRTATVPVTSFIDVMRNADRNIRLRRSLCCSVRMRSINADSASQASRRSQIRRSRSERSFLSSENVAFTSSCGAGHSANAGLKNQEMTGGDIATPPGGPTVWRRRRHWNLLSTLNQLSPATRRRGDDSTPIVK